MASKTIIFDSFPFDVAMGNVVVGTDSFFMMLTNGYTPDQANHTTRADVTNEVSGPGYTAGGLPVSVTVTKDAANHRTLITPATVTWTNATSFTCDGAAIYKRRGGLASADNLVQYVQFTDGGGNPISVTTVGQPFQVTVSRAMTWNNVLLLAAVVAAQALVAGTIQTGSGLNVPPVWNSVPGLIQANQGATVNLASYVTDANNDLITYSLGAGSLPTGWTLASNGVLTLPANATLGTAPGFQVYADDGVVQNAQFIGNVAGVVSLSPAVLNSSTVPLATAAHAGSVTAASLTTHLLLSPLALAAGTTVSAPGMGTASNAPLLDWVARSTGTGVTMATNFSGAHDFDWPLHVFANGDNATWIANVTHDTTDGILNDGSGGCCKVTWLSGQAGAGNWYSSINPAWTSVTQGIAGQPWWIQFRVKVPLVRYTGNPNDHTVPSSGSLRADGRGGGFKFCIVGGYIPGNPDSSSSDIDNEFVVQDVDYRGYPATYTHTVGPGGGWDGGYENFQTPFSSVYNPSDFLQQNAINRIGAVDQKHQYCLYSQDVTYVTNPANANVGAWQITPDVWMTFMVRINIQTKGAGSGAGNEFDFWAANYGDSAWTHIVAATGFPVAQDATYTGGPNGIWLLTYDTNNGVYSTTEWVKYAQLICSTQAIPLPAAGS